MSAAALTSPDKAIVLVGLMGCGKSAIGSRLATNLGWEFSDLDKEIEEREGLTVSEIFAQKGEAYFRQQELAVITELLNRKSYVIATGGGAFMNPAIRSLIQDHGISVWIRADFKLLLGRVSRKNNRPLLEQGDKKEILHRLMDERYPVYAQADITVDTSNAPHQVMVDKILESLGKSDD